jgi:hypothetical protein
MKLIVRIATFSITVIALTFMLFFQNSVEMILTSITFLLIATLLIESFIQSMFTQHGWTREAISTHRESSEMKKILSPKKVA